jgi:general secretion pathway protein K
MKREGSERGVALLMVLLVVALLTAVIVDFSFNTRLDARIAANVRDSLIASSLARSGYDMALTLLMEDASGEGSSGSAGGNEAVSAILKRARQEAKSGNSKGSSKQVDSVDSLQDAWARMDLLQIPLEEGQDLQVQVHDLAGRINLNAIITQGKGGTVVLNRPVFDQLVTLIDQALTEQDRGQRRDPEELSAEDIAYAIADWVDPDEIRLSDGAFEDEVYNSLSDPYSSKNGPFDSVAELQLVEGVDDALYAAIKDAVTVYPFEGGGAININTAPPTVLRSIRFRANNAIDTAEPLSEENITRILEARNEGDVLKSESDLRELLGLDAAAVFTPDITFGSNVFAIEALGKAGETTRRIQAVVDRGDEGPKVLYWRVD